MTIFKAPVALTSYDSATGISYYSSLGRVGSEITFFLSK